MNRDLTAAAAVLGITRNRLRDQLRAQGVLNHKGELISSPRIEGRLFTDTRSRWNPSIGRYTHYGVVMATEAGIGWLAELLDITVTITQHKDAAA